MIVGSIAFSTANSTIVNVFVQRVRFEISIFSENTYEKNRDENQTQKASFLIPEYLKPPFSTRELVVF